jgi:hypothetical protein
MSRRTLILPLALGLWSTATAAQTNVGELLDAGAKPLSAAEFREQIAQHIVSGALRSGTDMEIMYARSGVLIGEAWNRGDYRRLNIGGEWKIDDKDRVCASINFGGGGYTGQIRLPVGCEFWFKLGDKYFVADSDYDRDAKAVVRTLKR